MPHVDIELEDNKQFISNIPRISEGRYCVTYTFEGRYCFSDTFAGRYCVSDTFESSYCVSYTFER